LSHSSGAIICPLCLFSQIAPCSELIICGETQPSTLMLGYDNKWIAVIVGCIFVFYSNTSLPVYQQSTAMSYVQQQLQLEY